MTNSPRQILAAVLGIFAASAAFAEGAAAPLYTNDFSDPSRVAPLFERYPRMDVRDGVLSVSNEKGHAASPTLMVPFTDGVLRFRFRVAQGDGVICRFEETAHVAGSSAHLCRLEIQKNKVLLLLDQPPQEMERREKAVLAETKGSFTDGQWHTAEIRFAGEVMSAALDGTTKLEGRHPHLAERKIGTFFVVKQAVVELDDLVLTGSNAAATTPAAAPAPQPKSASAPAGSTDVRGLGLFHDYVEPMLKQECFKCHSHEAQKAKGGLVLDSRNAMLKGGDLGPALKPGDTEGSLLLEALRYHNQDLQMPPDGKLDDTLIAHVREWIELGAPDPRLGPDVAKGGAVAGPDRAKLWSVQPLKDTPPPAVKLSGWPRAELDRYLLAALEAKGLAPSPDAAPHQLLRRVHYVLTGLPQTVEEVERFTRECVEPGSSAIRPESFEKYVATLLASPHFGERWARHWLDLARYADVNGQDSPKAMPEAWRYRDYVVNAFNTDKPFERFVREQIAGDLLKRNSPEEGAENLVATAFISIGHVIKADRDPERQKLDTIDEQMEVLGSSLLGIRIGCARCHDHKLDPFPTRDYYALAGIFRSTLSLGGMSKEEAVQLNPQSLPLPPTPESAPAFLRGADGKTAKAHAARDMVEIRDEPIHLRGEVYVKGDAVPRGLPTLVAMRETPRLPANASGRAELADWLLSPENPLVQRVIVNRIWHHVFGQGLVRTTDNFGFTGDPPSHPELLDYLARRFREHHRGSFKSFITELLLSHAWQQSAVARPDGMKSDPQNRLLWRVNPRRADAEPLVDALQFLAGRLDLEPLAGNGVPKFKSGNQFSTAELAIEESVLRKRALYWPIFRKDVPLVMDLLGIFDEPPATSVRGRRATTSVPSQSLALLDSPFVHQSAGALLKLLPNADDATRLSALYQRLYARHPSAAEIERAVNFLDTFSKELIKTRARPNNARTVAWNRLCHSLLISNEFIVIE